MRPAVWVWVFRYGRQAGWATQFRYGEAQNYATSTDQRSSGEGEFEGKRMGAVERKVEVRVKREGSNVGCWSDARTVAGEGKRYVRHPTSQIPAAGNASANAHNNFRRGRWSFHPEGLVTVNQASHPLVAHCAQYSRSPQLSGPQLNPAHPDS